MPTGILGKPENFLDVTGALPPAFDLSQLIVDRPQAHDAAQPPMGPSAVPENVVTASL